jgi:anti-sigma regulatory factor (Ser/Thr protein kinase)
VNGVSDRVLVCTLPAEPQSVAEARRVITRACELAGQSGERGDQTVLLTSELVTNAILYGRSNVRLAVSWSPTWMRVEVGDDNTRPPIMRTTDPSAIDGRGITLVNELADDWGVQSDADGKHVWFTMSTQHSSTLD